jgi:transcriptional regulator with XRE-family HTH domain
MKVYRSGLGLSQAKLAEKVNTAPNYIALIEMCKRFPSVKILERIAAALDVDSVQLFSQNSSEEERIKRIHQNLVSGIEQVVASSLRELKEGQ